jgi:hypothetical protein
VPFYAGVFKRQRCKKKKERKKVLPKTQRAPKTPRACENHEKQLKTEIVHFSVSSCFS